MESQYRIARVSNHCEEWYDEAWADDGKPMPKEVADAKCEELNKHVTNMCRDYFRVVPETYRLYKGIVP